MCIRPYHSVPPACHPRAIRTTPCCPCATPYRAIADLHQTALGDDVDEMPNDERAVDVVGRVRIVAHEVRTVVDDLPVPRDRLVWERLFRGVVVAVFEMGANSAAGLKGWGYALSAGGLCCAQGV